MFARGTELGKKGIIEPYVVTDFECVNRPSLFAIHHLISILTAFIQPLTWLCSVFKMTGTRGCVLIGGAVC